MNKLMLLLLVCLSLCIITNSTEGAQFDGSRTLICALIEIHECAPGGDCQRVRAEDINIPQFFTIDVKTNKIQGTNPDGTVRSTAIERLEHVSGKLILQGGEEGKGWTLAIDEKTGKMSLAIAGEEAGFVIFGACIVFPAE
jgi:hypothetical protein